MKKILLRTVTIISIIVLSVASFAGCGLITTNTEMDMDQKIAKVQIATDIDEEYVQKREMISAYMSYGYYYVANYNMTVSAVYEMILKNLVQNRVIIQQARKELAKTYNAALTTAEADRTEFLNYFVENATASKTAIDFSNGSDETLKKYLTEYEIAQANYNIVSSINSMIDSYLDENSHAGHDHDHDHDEETENETFSARSNPSSTDSSDLKEYELKDAEKGKITDDQYKVADVTLKTEGGWEALKAAYEAAGKTVYDLNLEVYKKAEVDVSTTEREKAKNKAIKALKTNGLIGKSENVKDVRDYSYFKRALTNQYESLIVSKFEDSLITEAESRVTNDALWEQFKAEYETQKANYTGDVSAYETALEAVNDEKFVLSNPYEGYGYVANLLIGFSDDQKTMLSDYSKKAGISPAQISDYRKKLLTQLYAKDQRTTWVQSSYGTYDKDTNTFDFDAKYFKSDVKSDEYAALKTALGKYIGDIDFDKEHITENADKVDVTTYTFNNLAPTAISFDEFYSSYVSGLIPGMTAKHYEKDEIGQVELTEKVRNTFDDLMYAFSTDPGCLGNYYGYLYSPITSASKYVPEFAAAAKAVVEKGEGAYTIVATDYGYHIILCTKVVESDEKNAENYMNKGDEAACKKAFIDALNVEGSLAAKYKKLKLDSVTSDIVSKIANNFINGYMDGNIKDANGNETNDKCVIYYEKTYSDLITEPTSSND